MQKILLIGLGNIGSEYAETRHNVGFKVVEQLAKRHHATWDVDTLANRTQYNYKGKQWNLIQPSTYMNLSGKSMKYWLTQLSIEKENALVIVDDLAIDFAKIRIKTKGSDGGHNGLKSINETLQTTEYARLRVGIGCQFSKGKQVDYVLGRWSNEELKELPFLLGDCADAAEAVFLQGFGPAMTLFNK